MNASIASSPASNRARELADAERKCRTREFRFRRLSKRPIRSAVPHRLSSMRRHPVDEIQDLARDTGVCRADRQQLRHVIVPQALPEAWPDAVILHELGEECGMR